ncbi:MAG: hypothetical protein AAGE89_14280 [Pseudomonadota bacterium]
MHDRINELLGWEEDTQRLIRNLSKADISILIGAKRAHEGNLPQSKNNEPDTGDVKAYQDRPNMVHMTTKDSANAALFKRLETKGWMEEGSPDFPPEIPDELRESTVEYGWTEKGARLLPQLLAYYFASGNTSPDHVFDTQIH